MTTRDRRAETPFTSDHGDTWTLSKSVVRSKKGMVASQNMAASEAGASILARGGNAVDAAVGTAFALAASEPWMSGLGGGGFMVVAPGDGGPVEVVDFGMISSRNLQAARYPLDEEGGLGEDIFGWPAVVEGRNVEGGDAVCVPGAVDGLGVALERFGKKSLAEVLGPAIEMAEAGLPVEWHTTLQIAVEAEMISRHETAAKTYLPTGMPPISKVPGKPIKLSLGALPETLRRLAKNGRRDFYEGGLAEDMVADLRDAGSPIDGIDLSSYRSNVSDPASRDYRDVVVSAAAEPAGGAMLMHALADLEQNICPGAHLDAASYVAYAECLDRAFHHRQMSNGAPGHGRMGHVPDPARSAAAHTTHLSVVDRDGTMVSLTTTLLSRFGSKVLLPRTGILMNNGVSWFDPRPERANGVGPGKRPRANMCPIIAHRRGKPWLALGASGGRRIVPAILQVLSFLTDYRMSLEEAFHTPRIDAGHDKVVLCDRRMPSHWIACLADRFKVRAVDQAVYPSNFAVPQAVLCQGEFRDGMTHIANPAAGVAVG